MSWIKSLKDAFVVELDALLSDVVISEWVPEIEREKLTQPELRVFPVSRTVTAAARAYKRRTAVIGVLFVDALPKESEDQIESALQLVEQFEDLLNTRVDGFAITAIDYPQVVDPQEWRENRAISITVLFTFEAQVL